MDAAVAGLIGALGGSAIGAGITAALTIYRDHRDTKENYKAMLYEKRLEIYQEAFHLAFELLESVPESVKELNKDRRDEIFAANKKILNFWKLRCLYLDSESLKAIASLIHKVSTIYDIFKSLSENPPIQEGATKYNEWYAEFQQSVTKFTIALEKGIGMKHIEQLKIHSA